LREPILNRPRLDDDTSRPEFLSPDRLGFPLLERRSRMSDARRFLPDSEACARLEASDASSPIVPFAGRIKGRWETVQEQRRAIEHELAGGRDLLESRLGTSVRHICLPWGISGRL